MTLSLSGPLFLVGAGKMGGALLDGWLAHGLDAGAVFIQDPRPPPEMVALMARHGIAQGPPPEAPAVIVLAVKPQIMDAVLPPMRARARAGAVVLSIAAGRTIASIARHLGATASIVRAMPNTPAAVGRGITVACANPAVTRQQRATCTQLLAAVGTVAWVEDEAMLDSVTAVSGSGPAYVFLLAECLALAGVEAGLAPELAARLARETVSGAGELLHRAGDDPAALRRNVTSPGGTTAAALEVLMGEGGLQQLMTSAVAAAARRSRALSS